MYWFWSCYSVANAAVINERIKRRATVTTFNDVFGSGDFDCSDNALTSLEYGPTEIDGFYNCSNNKLRSLEGAPQIVEADFICSGNELSALLGAPKNVSDNFDCSNNQLESLDGAPEGVGMDFNCAGNKKKFTKKEVQAVCKVGGKIILS